MVVDEDLVAGGKRRFLAYDLLALNGASLAARPWWERYAMLGDLVVEPRQRERRLIDAGRWTLPYRYGAEPFAVRRKEFFPLARAAHLLDSFIPALSHESDGLILQRYHEPVVPGTAPELLKWKFAHLNSVDFRLRMVAPTEGGGGGPPVPALVLMETRRDAGRRRGDHVLEGATVLFPEGTDPAPLDFRIVECSWDGDAGAWVFMRERRDKTTPNAYHVYESVVQSIKVRCWRRRGRWVAGVIEIDFT